MEDQTVRAIFIHWMALEIIMLMAAVAAVFPQIIFIQEQDLMLEVFHQQVLHKPLH